MMPRMKGAGSHWDSSLDSPASVLMNATIASLSSSRAPRPDWNSLVNLLANLYELRSATTDYSVLPAARVMISRLLMIRRTCPNTSADCIFRDSGCAAGGD